MFCLLESEKSQWLFLSQHKLRFTFSPQLGAGQPGGHSQQEPGPLHHAGSEVIKRISSKVKCEIFRHWRSDSRQETEHRGDVTWWGQHVSRSGPPYPPGKHKQHDLSGNLYLYLPSAASLYSRILLSKIDHWVSQPIPTHLNPLITSKSNIDGKNTWGGSWSHDCPITRWGCPVRWKLKYIF